LVAQLQHMHGSPVVCLLEVQAFSRLDWKYALGAGGINQWCSLKHGIDDIALDREHVVVIRFKLKGIGLFLDRAGSKSGRKTGLTKMVN
jgi:hypothetical protein